MDDDLFAELMVSVEEAGRTKSRPNGDAGACDLRQEL
jgi:hypothetical protein